jgi:hypothetical protein
MNKRELQQYDGYQRRLLPVAQGAKRGQTKLFCNIY